ncbi:transcriptional regulator, HxlR family [Stanieria cyanosphaera PCC 7437]|uniref:Transcriptional regulator, HxlR family n=2 Tax=Stanieria cyanosphaera TaxID=102116 RepID=K9XXX9_STAC7|nr:transcriptional regulator, HxlR family [Stanieria cyanosphaera PCC 7437]
MYSGSLLSRKSAPFSKVVTVQSQMQSSQSRSLPKKISASQPTVAYIVEHTLGCKWMLEVLRLIRQGINRSGAMTRATEGLITKVLNERLVDLVNFGIVEKVAYPEIPPRVEYNLTVFGSRFIEILDIIDDLEEYCQSRL